MRRFAFFGPAALGLAAIVLVIGIPSVALGDDDRRDFTAHFLGVNETPSISTDATADLTVRINGSGDNARITYTLTFSGLRAPVTQAHIHFAQSKVAGGIMVFLCGTAASPGPA
ncbi:MAG: CHRD domain-containing protein, partial [Chloroflexi bacterium]|nr:CHRD domain-containing protein [Chloroflexota bacterium]